MARTYNLHYRLPREVEPGIWTVLVRGRPLLLGVFVVCLFVGVFVFAKPPVSEYTTSIEIGGKMPDGEANLIESPQALLAKVRERYIPQALAEYRAGHKDIPSFHIDATVPKNSTILVLKTKGTQDQATEITALLAAVTDKIKADQEFFYADYRKQLELRHGIESNTLAELLEQATLLDGERTRMEAFGQLLHEQARDLAALIQRLKSTREAAGRFVTQDNLVLFDSELNKAHEELWLIKERLLILPSELDALGMSIAEIQRRQQALRSGQSFIDSALATFKTRTITPPMRIKTPPGVSRSVLAFLVFSGSVILSVLAVLLVEFWSNGEARGRAIPGAGAPGRHAAATEIAA